MKVAVLWCPSYEKELESVIKKAFYHINFNVKPHSKVLLKPNVLGTFRPEEAVTTHPSVIDAVCKVLREKSAEIYIGDSSGDTARRGSTSRAFKVSGIEEVANKNKAVLVNFDNTELLKVANPDNKILKEAYIPKIIREADIIINLPKLKTHNFLGYTGAVKNLFGTIPGTKKSIMHFVMGNPEKFAEMLTDLHNLVKPDFHILDGVTGLEGNGPFRGTPKQSSLIVASRNAFALDVVASGLIGYKPYDIMTNKAALKRGIVPDIEVIGDRVKAVYKKPPKIVTGILTYMPSFLKREFYKNTFHIDSDKCRDCEMCVEKCPTRAIISRNNIKIIDQKKCINCNRCYEICAKNAVVIKRGRLLKTARKLYR